MRRLTKPLLPALFLALAGAGALCAGLAAERFPVRVDVTATGEHELSARSRLILGELTGAWRLVLAADESRITPDRLRRLQDVFDSFERADLPAGASIDATRLDAGSPVGATAFAELLAQLASDEQGRIDRQTALVRAAAAELAAVAQAAPELSSRLMAVADAISAAPEGAVPSADDNRSFFVSRASAVRQLGEDIGPVLAAVEQRLDEENGPTLGPPSASVRIPRPDLASAALGQPVEAATAQLDGLARELGRFGSSQAVPDSIRRDAGQLAIAVRTLTDRLATAAEPAQRLDRPDVLRIADAVAGGEAMIVAGPAGVTAIDLNALLPDAQVLESLGLRAADARRRSEELIATALGSLVLDEPPVVVLVHGEGERFLGRVPVFERARERLGVRGIDVVEWPAAIEPERPSFASVDPAGTRTKVYVTLAPDGTAAGGGRAATGAERRRVWADAVAGLVEAGEPVLLTLNPSVLPSFGDADPQNRILAPFGLRAATGAPLLGEARAEGERRVLADFQTTVSAGEHPIRDAIAGQRLLLPWAVAVEPFEDDAAVVGLVRTPEASSMWGETAWLALWRTPREQRSLLANPPAFDDGEDQSGDDRAVVVAATRTTDEGTSRIVAVGSNAWHIDQVLGQATLVDGRAVPVHPGNLELLEASVYWLAGQETLIAPSARIGSAPTIRALGASDLNLIRGLVAFGPAALVLLFGIGWRALRG